jgi:hypothetical protein
MISTGSAWRSRRALDGHLADMVRDGTLENSHDPRQRGYRLPTE